MNEPKLPRRPNQGSAADCKYAEPVKGETSGVGGGKIVPPVSTPGKGTRGRGTTHNSVGR